MDKIKSLLSGNSTEDKSTETSQYGTEGSEASTDQQGRKVSTGADFVGGQSERNTSHTGQGSHVAGEHQSGISTDSAGLTGTGVSESELAFGAGKYGSAQGPHTTHTANLLDPALNSGTGQESAYHHSAERGGGAEEADSSHSPKVASSAYTAPTTSQYGSTTTTSSTSATNPDGSSSAISSGSRDHHRDAALVGGAGAAGAGAYAVDKHLKSDTRGTDVTNPGSSTITGQHTAGSGVKSNVERKADSTTESGSTRDQHYGAAGSTLGSSAVASTALYETQQHKHDKDLTEAERDAKKQQKHDEKEAKKEAKKEHHHEKDDRKDSKGGILSFLQRDKNKKYSAEEEAEFDRQEREQNSSHAARNTAISAGAVGTGVAAHEADQHRDSVATTGSSSTKKDIGDILHGEDRNRGVVGSSGFPGEPGFGDGAVNTNRDWRETVREAQEAYNIGGPVPLHQKPVGKDYGDYLHGDRNRGVVGESGFPGTEGFGSGVGTGPGVGTSVDSDAKVDHTGTSSGRTHGHDSTIGSHTGTTALSSQYDNSTSASGGGSKIGGVGHIGSDTPTGSHTGATASSSQYDNSKSASGGGSKIGGVGHVGSDTTTGNSHVPASSTARSQIISEGKNDIDSNSGVANAGNTSGSTY